MRKEQKLQNIREINARKPDVYSIHSEREDHKLKNWEKYLFKQKKQLKSYRNFQK